MMNNIYLDHHRQKIKIKNEWKSAQLWISLLCEFVGIFFYVFLGGLTTLDWSFPPESSIPTIPPTTPVSVLLQNETKLDQIELHHPELEKAEARRTTMTPFLEVHRSHTETYDDTHSSMTYALVLTAICQCFYRVSGAHFNPAVTLSVWISRRISFLRAVLYILVHFLGAITGAGILYAFIPEAHRGLLNVLQLHPNLSAFRGFLLELTLTFIICLTYHSAWDHRHPCCKASNLPLMYGAAVGGAHLVGVKLTGCGVNPARAFGPALVMNDWHHHWIYHIGPILAAILAAICYNQFLSPDKGKRLSVYVAKAFQSLTGKPDDDDDDKTKLSDAPNNTINTSIGEDRTPSQVSSQGRPPSSQIRPGGGGWPTMQYLGPRKGAEPFEGPDRVYYEPPPLGSVTPPSRMSLASLLSSNDPAYQRAPRSRQQARGRRPSSGSSGPYRPGSRPGSNMSAPMEALYRKPYKILSPNHKIYPRNYDDIPHYYSPAVPQDKLAGGGGPSKTRSSVDPDDLASAGEEESSEGDIKDTPRKLSGGPDGQRDNPKGDPRLAGPGGKADAKDSPYDILKDRQRPHRGSGGESPQGPEDTGEKPVGDPMLGAPSDKAEHGDTPDGLPKDGQKPKRGSGGESPLKPEKKPLFIDGYLAKKRQPKDNRNPKGQSQDSSPQDRQDGSPDNPNLAAPGAKADVGDDSREPSDQKNKPKRQSKDIEPSKLRANVDKKTPHPELSAPGGKAEVKDTPVGPSQQPKEPDMEPIDKRYSPQDDAPDIPPKQKDAHRKGHPVDESIVPKLAGQTKAAPKDRTKDHPSKHKKKPRKHHDPNCPLSKKKDKRDSNPDDYNPDDSEYLEPSDLNLPEFRKSRDSGVQEMTIIPLKAPPKNKKIRFPGEPDRGSNDSDGPHDGYLTTPPSDYDDLRNFYRQQLGEPPFPEYLDLVDMADQPYIDHNQMERLQAQQSPRSDGSHPESTQPTGDHIRVLSSEIPYVDIAHMHQPGQGPPVDILVTPSSPLNHDHSAPHLQVPSHHKGLPHHHQHRCSCGLTFEDDGSVSSLGSHHSHSHHAYPVYYQPYPSYPGGGYMREGVDESQHYLHESVSDSGYSIDPWEPSHNGYHLVDSSYPDGYTLPFDYHQQPESVRARDKKKVKFNGVGEEKPSPRPRSLLERAKNWGPIAKATSALKKQSKENSSKSGPSYQTTWRKSPSPPTYTVGDVSSGPNGVTVMLEPVKKTPPQTKRKSPVQEVQEETQKLLAELDQFLEKDKETKL